ncbi:MAG TPA: hypothetical protein VGS57_22090 [Thermoanaerobaculia bacterium]|jgi:hypothetical protein|nr:hypothetical protein [Thermoanaerobaculia bacterium]
MQPIQRVRTVVLAASAAALALLVSPTLSRAQAIQNGPLPQPLPLFPADNWWNLDVSQAPLDPNSASFINYVGPTRALHPDFGGDAGSPSEPDIYGFPYASVGADQPLVPVHFVDYGDESDAGAPGRPAGYPIPPEARTQARWIEGGWAGDDADAGGDRHLLIVDRDRKILYELYDTAWRNGRWEAGSGAVFLLTDNGRRPEGWTSADAAGLAIFPGLIRGDEVFGGEPIRHAFRVTVQRSNGYVWPASHRAGDSPGALPMGARLRLKASKDISGYSPYVQKIFQAMKTYGLIVADNGTDMYVQGTYDRRWDNDVLNPAFASLRASDFEVVQLGWRGGGGGNGGGGGGFHAVPPCRLIDTRNANGELGGPALAPNVPRTFGAAGRCGVPANAKALSADVSLLQVRRAGTLKLFAAGAAANSGVSLSFRPPRGGANGVRVPLSAAGAFAAKSSRPVQLLLDVTGYFD